MLPDLNYFIIFSKAKVVYTHRNFGKHKELEKLSREKPAAHQLF
jgi:hypothetical protein